ncbi:MAG: hypothetical protein AB7S48_00865 [Bacteroidales bacterium]
MKKQFFLFFALLLISFGCSDDNDSPLTVGFKGLSTLLNKTPEAIQKASPGVFNAENSTDEKMYFDYEGHPTLGNVEIFYKINNGICDQVSLYLDDYTLDASLSLINLSEREFGHAFTYYIIYYNNTHGNYFDTYQELKDFIANNNLTINNIDYIEAKYKYKGKVFYVGAMIAEGIFLPFADMVVETKEVKS